MGSLIRITPDALDRSGESLTAAYLSSFEPAMTDLNRLLQQLNGAWSGAASSEFEARFSGWLGRYERAGARTLVIAARLRRWAGEYRALEAQQAGIMRGNPENRSTRRAVRGIGLASPVRDDPRPEDGEPVEIQPPEYETGSGPRQAGPDPRAGEPGGGSDTTYTVRSGDTLWAISQRTGVSIDVLRRANGLVSDVIYPGQRLILPGVNTPIPTDPDYGSDPIPGQQSRVANGVNVPYAVRAGDTLFDLARRYGTTVEAIRAANQLSGDQINVGQQLVIPRTGGQSGDTYLPVIDKDQPGDWDGRTSLYGCATTDPCYVSGEPWQDQVHHQTTQVIPNRAPLSLIQVRPDTDFDPKTGFQLGVGGGNAIYSASSTVDYYREGTAITIAAHSTNYGDGVDGAAQLVVTLADGQQRTFSLGDVDDGSHVQQFYIDDATNRPVSYHVRVTVSGQPGSYQLSFDGTPLVVDSQAVP